MGLPVRSVLATLSNMMNMFSCDPKTLGVDEKPTTLLLKSVDPNYFAALGIPVLSSRVFDDRDTADATRVVVINEALARLYFPGQNPLGKILPLGTKPEDHRQIVGVVGDIRDLELKQEPRPQFYFPLLQTCYSPSIHVYLRTKEDEPAQLASALQQAVWAVDKDIPVTHIQSMAAIISQSVAEPRFRTWLLSAFALAGLTLTLIGIYGVISY